MSNIWFSTTSFLFWSFILNYMYRTYIENMYRLVGNLGLKGFWNSSTSEQTSNHAHDHLIFPFCHSILLRSIGCGELTMYPIGCIELNKLGKCEILTSISSQTLDTNVSLSTSFLTFILKSWNILKASDFFVKKKTHNSS